MLLSSTKSTLMGGTDPSSRLEAAGLTDGIASPLAERAGLGSFFLLGLCPAWGETGRPGGVMAEANSFG